MEFIIGIVVAFVMMIWYIRPIYNFFAKRKYSLIEPSNKTIKSKFLTGLPAIAFYVLLIGLIFYPVYMNELLNGVASGTIIASEILAIFIFTRYDKRQSKYFTNGQGIHFRNKFISWEANYKVKFKLNVFLFLHKPRFIIKTNNTTIVIPILSKSINQFLEHFSNHAEKELANNVLTLFENTKNYYLVNNLIEKKINK